MSKNKGFRISLSDVDKQYNCEGLLFNKKDYVVDIKVK